MLWGWWEGIYKYYKNNSGNVRQQACLQLNTDRFVTELLLNQIHKGSETNKQRPSYASCNQPMHY